MKGDTTNDAPETVDKLPDDLQAEADALLAESDAEVEAEARATEPDTTPDPETALMLSQLAGVTFNGILAPRRGAHWSLQQAECDMLGQAVGPVLDKYLPGFNVGVEAAAIIALASVIGPRLAIDARTKRGTLNSEDDVPEPDFSIGDEVAGDGEGASTGSGFSTMGGQS